MNPFARFGLRFGLAVAVFAFLIGIRVEVSKLRLETAQAKADAHEAIARAEVALNETLHIENIETNNMAMVLQLFEKMNSNTISLEIIVPKPETEQPIIKPGKRDTLL
jgi:hypothetical protein